ncbi:MAG: MauE/DoxX family redox-associated membrane protein [Actinomycetota bacterium]
MAETITPMVHGGSRRKWGTAVGAHTLGAGLSAAVFGAALGWGGAALGAPWGTTGMAILTLVAAMYAARELFGLPVPVPERRQQVPEHWRWRFSPFVASFLYGLGLGVGFLTHVRHGTLVVVAAAAAMTGDPVVGAAVMAPFGLARGVSLLVTAAARSSERLEGVAAQLDRIAASRLPRVVNGAALAALVTVGAASVAARTGVDLRPLLAAGLAAVFAWAAASKLLAPREWRGSLGAYRLGALERPVIVGVPLAEAVVGLLILGGDPDQGAILALVLLGGFSAAIVRARALHGSLVPCGCFGQTKARDYRLLLLRNLGLGAVATVVLATGSSFPLLRWARLPVGGELVAAALAAAGLALAAWLARTAATALRRQPG